MEKGVLKRAIILGYCVSILLVVTYVPWKVVGQNENGFFTNLYQGYSFAFSPPIPSASIIDLNFVILEIIALTAFAVACFVMRNTIKMIIDRIK